MSEERTHIRLSKDTKKRLKKYGEMGDSYEDVIKMLLAYYEEKEVKRENEREGERERTHDNRHER